MTTSEKRDETLRERCQDFLLADDLSTNALCAFVQQELRRAAAVARSRRGPCIFTGCDDDANANYPVCYKHRQEAHAGGAVDEAYREGQEEMRRRALSVVQECEGESGSEDALLSGLEDDIRALPIKSREGR